MRVQERKKRKREKGYGDDNKKEQQLQTRAREHEVGETIVGSHRVSRGTYSQTLDDVWQAAHDRSAKADRPSQDPDSSRGARF